MEWHKIKHEYVTTDTSYRKLASKYKVRLRTLAEKAKEEDWVSERVQYRNDVYTKNTEQSAKTDADRIAKHRKLADRVLDEMDKNVEGATLYELKQISGILKDLQSIKTDADLEEQAQRIANLRRQAGTVEPEIEDNAYVSAELFPDETPHA
ncbi:MAG: hypothetical protein IJX47_02325 [Clostridia bacterium]|nr:hypothetical protein [Clostridia bacterium]